MQQAQHGEGGIDGKPVPQDTWGMRGALKGLAGMPKPIPAEKFKLQKHHDGIGKQLLPEEMTPFPGVPISLCIYDNMTSVDISHRDFRAHRRRACGSHGVQAAGRGAAVSASARKVRAWLDIAHADVN
eukprot:1326108-Rhodomonas_salina.1